MTADCKILLIACSTLLRCFSKPFLITSTSKPKTCEDIMELLVLTQNPFSLLLIPHELFNCSKLLDLSLSGNSLNGSLPSEIASYELRLSRNSFSGQTPDEIGQLQNLQSILDLSYNNLTGKIPPSIGTLSKLETLDLSHNQLTGELPQVSEMRSLGRLNFSYNNFQGKLDRLYAHWPADAFAGNMNICGSPHKKCKDLMLILL
ncbi:LRR receptor-like serine/threonine-protein kinase GSO1 [Abeliophyllum distichum]|uniref:LRR receptor-like serine/threonine-protein kinase GSO1 n=1 Tax=Abeliophyllum distichum TaxID=126358 RepID=A0ABD1T2I9_9LAMI